MQIFDDILEILSDGHYHAFEELQTRLTGRNENQIELALSFLETYSFVKRLRKRWSTRTRRVQLTEPMLRFVKRFKELAE